MSKFQHLEPHIHKAQWIVIDQEYCYKDEVVTTYRNFSIALTIPNGGICAITIWNEDKSIVETVDTENYDKYCDKEWHIEQAKLRINQILSPISQLSLFKT